MVEDIVRWLVDGLKSVMPPELVITLISMLPILELRGGLIAASETFLNVNILTAVPLCILGNIIPIPFILWFITPLFDAMKKTKLFRPMVERLEKKALSKSDRIQKGYFWGLALFVGIPLPGTGAWTGALIAALLDIPKKKSIPAILVGIAIATVIMSIVSYGLLDTITGLFR